MAALVVLAVIAASFAFMGLLEWARIDWPRMMFGTLDEDDR